MNFLSIYFERKMDRGQDIHEKIQQQIDFFEEFNSDLPEIEYKDEYDFSRSIRIFVDSLSAKNIRIRISGNNISGCRRELMTKTDDIKKIFMNACEYLKNLPRWLSKIFVLKYSKSHACRLSRKYDDLEKEKKMKLCGLFLEFEKVYSLMGTNQVIDIYLLHLWKKIMGMF